MIPMACPNCGRRGTVPPDRLNTRMHCKKCDAVFHMDPSGKIMLGEPDADKQARRKAQKAAEGEPFDPIGALAASKTFRAVVVVALVGLAGYFLIGRLLKLGPKTPRTLPGRTDYVAEAFIDRDLGRLRRVTTSATRGDLQAWLDKERPKLAFEGKQEPGNDVIVNVFVDNADEGAGSAVTTAMFILPAVGDPAEPDATPDAAKAKKDNAPPLLRLAWVREGESWLLDVKRTTELDAKK